MKNTKILICYHKKAPLLKDEVFTPIHVGRDLAIMNGNPSLDWLIENCIGDNTGENISSKNASYNEMTSLYWAWKNYDVLGNPDYIGFMHYRRHFVFREGQKGEIRFDDVDFNNYYNQINYSPEKLDDFLNGQDFIVHLGTVDNVYKHYTDSHRKEDLDEVISIAKEFHPEMCEVIDEYFSGNDSNFCNMFILSRELFFKYCEFVFPILEEFERRVDLTDKRLFVSERVSGIFFAFLMKQSRLKYKVVPISYIDSPVPVKIALHKKENTIFPLAVTLRSLALTKNDKSVYDIRIVSKSRMSRYEIYALQKCINDAKNISLEFVIDDTESLVSRISNVFSEDNKCIVMSDHVVALNDLSEFFPTVSVDDYFVAGGPILGFNDKSKIQISDDMMVLNLAKIRKKNIVDINCEHTGYIPQYYLTVTSDETENWTIFDSNRSRQRVIDDSSWKRMIMYNTWTPWDKPQEPLALYWWNIAKELPVTIPFPCSGGERFIEELNNEQKQVNAKAFGEEIINEDSVTTVENHENEEWRNYSMLGKLKYYYDHNGLKNTIVYCSNKYLRRA